MCSATHAMAETTIFWRRTSYGTFRPRKTAIMRVTIALSRKLCGSMILKYCWHRWRLFGRHGGSGKRLQPSHSSPKPRHSHNANSRKSVSRRSTYLEHVKWHMPHDQHQPHCSQSNSNTTLLDDDDDSMSYDSDSMLLARQIMCCCS